MGYSTHSIYYLCSTFLYTPAALLPSCLMQVHQLRTVYSKIHEMLSFDIVSQLPVEVSVMIMSYLDDVSLCAGAQCCHSWRNLANTDDLWYSVNVLCILVVLMV